MLLVLDATPIIHLSKIGFASHLIRMGYKLVTTPQVERELKLGENRFHEVQSIKELIAAKKLVVRKTAREPPPVRGLSGADASVVWLAKELNAVAVVDDSLAKAYAQTLGVRTVHSSTLVINAVAKKAISAEPAIRFIDELVASGWRCDVETYKNIVNAIKHAGVRRD